MRLLITALLFVGGLFFSFVGVGFLTDPVASAAGFGLAPDSTMGLATIRADLTAFFLVAGFCMVWGAWRRNGDPLLIAAALFAVAFIGRAVNAAVVGAYEGFWVPMPVEAAAVALNLAGSRVLPHRVIAD